MATVAVFLLVGVGIVSARAARRRLSYETWHFIHLYTYLAVALAFSHQFATGADFIGQPEGPLAVVVALHLRRGAAALVPRRHPAPRAARHQLRVVEVHRESADVVSVYVTGRHLDELRAEPGQFFRWRFLTRDLWWAANPYSLSAPPRPDMLRITVKIAGDHSAALLALRPGTRVLAEGPYGSFTAARRRRRKVLLLAGGVGITPLRALFETLPAAPATSPSSTAPTRPRTWCCGEELDWIAAQRGARVHYLIGPPRHGANDHARLTPAAAPRPRPAPPRRVPLRTGAA